MEDLERGSILDSGIPSAVSSGRTAAVDTEAGACAGPRGESTGPGPAGVLSPLNLHSNPMN